MTRCMLPLLFGLLLSMACVLPAAPQATAGTLPQADDPAPPPAPVKLIFIHHSTGQNWLSDWDGGLGAALGANNYFVSDTNYGWGPDAIGDRTDIPDWPAWFTGSNHGAYLAALYAESGQHSDYTRTLSDPGGENRIVMFKSCFPNSNLGGKPDDLPLPAPNDEYTVANAKAVYNDILVYFATRQDKLFVVIAAPPLAEGDTTPAQAGNARAFDDWLVHDWLAGYPHRNVAVFDFYNVLTSNGGDPDTNDLGATDGNHHRWWEGAVQHMQGVDDNYAAYPTGDSHPSQAGNQKATGEFVELLNVFYNRWVAEPGCVGLREASIAGSTVGYTDTLYTFPVTLTPITATAPISYTWGPDPASGQGSALSGYQWPALGWQTITLTAANCGGVVTATHAIEVIERVAPTHFVYLASMEAAQAANARSRHP